MLPYPGPTAMVPTARASITRPVALSFNFVQVFFLSIFSRAKLRLFHRLGGGIESIRFYYVLHLIAEREQQKQKWNRWAVVAAVEEIRIQTREIQEVMPNAQRSQSHCRPTDFSPVIIQISVRNVTRT